MSRNRLVANDVTDDGPSASTQDAEDLGEHLVPVTGLDKVEDATITLRTRIERQFTIIGNRHRAVLRIDIMDNGPGIDKDIQQHLFYPMITRRKGGTGLGLTFAQSIISQHHGMIEFESRPGETIFSIYIPLEQTQ